jgi:hypothetical protein
MMMKKRLRGKRKRYSLGNVLIKKSAVVVPPVKKRKAKAEQNGTPKPREKKPKAPKPKKAQVYPSQPSNPGRLSEEKIRGRQGEGTI